MRNAKVFLIIICATIFVFACAGKKKPRGISVQESIRVEASLFRQNCVVCHGAEAQGKELEARNIPSLREGDVTQKDDLYLYNQISNGGNGMPPFKYQFTENQTRNMVNFLRELQRSEAKSK